MHLEFFIHYARQSVDEVDSCGSIKCFSKIWTGNLPSQNDYTIPMRHSPFSYFTFDVISIKANGFYRKLREIKSMRADIM